MLSLEQGMADLTYQVVIRTNTELSDWELDELRQVVVDFISPDEDTEIEVVEA